MSGEDSPESLPSVKPSTSAWPCLRDFLPHRFRLREQIQIIRAAGLGVGSRHIEPAKRMSTHHCASALAVQVKISNMKFADRSIQLLPRLAVYASGQPKLGVIRDL